MTTHPRPRRQRRVRRVWTRPGASPTRGAGRFVVHDASTRHTSRLVGCTRSTRYGTIDVRRRAKGMMMDKRYAREMQELRRSNATRPRRPRVARKQATRRDARRAAIAEAR